MARIEIKGKSDQARSRRFALYAQGLTRNAPFGRGLSGAYNAISHLGYVQIDTISVVERAHNHVIRARVPNYTSEMLDRLLKQRRVFEYWSHAAAFLPIQDFRYSLPYKDSVRAGDTHWTRSRDEKLMAQMLERIDKEGPLRSRDVEDRRGSSAGWWDWKPAKRALEQLFMQGDLMVSAREGFQKTYDLTERVLPSGINTSTPTTREFAEHLVDQQLRCHGLVSLKGMTYLRRNAALREAASIVIKQRVGAGELDELLMPDNSVFYSPSGHFEQSAPRVAKLMRILSPFDNAVIQRDRVNTLFDFDYQIECYVPQAKRKYGYFCLPLLYADQFVGRMDCKAHRKHSILELKAVHFCEHPFDQHETVAALARVLPDFVAFQGCDAITLSKVTPTQLHRPLEAAIEEKQCNTRTLNT